MRPMSFTARLTADLLQVEPGATVAVTLEVSNRTDARDYYEIAVEGLDPEWAAVPIPTFSIEAREVHTERLFLKPPRVSESLAGDYPFVVRVRSLETGESKTVPAVLTLQPYNQLTLEVAPKRVVVGAGFMKVSTFEVVATNLGNVEHQLKMAASDPDDGLTFEWDMDQVTLPPGRQEVVRLSPSAKKRPLLASPRLSQVTVTARSVANPTIATSAQAQVEQRALFSPTFVLVAFFLIALIAGYVALWPREPVMERLMLSNEEAVVGETVKLTWSARYATDVIIKIGDETFREDPEGDRDVPVTAEGQLEIEATAIRGEATSKSLMKVLVARPRPTVPDPKVDVFEITPRELKVGQTYLVKYKLSGNVTEAFLDPLGVPLDPRLEGKQLEAGVAGNLELKIRARNAEGKEVLSKPLVLTVVEGSLAKVVSFTSTPPTFTGVGGDVVLSWNLTNASRAELVWGDERADLAVPAGTKTVSVLETTQFTLYAYDTQNQRVEAKLSVVIQPEQPEPDPMPNNPSEGLKTDLPGPQ